jgi:putative FmdB family regulatory protein
MPFYEYACSKCGARAEVFSRSMTATVAAPVCPGATGKAATAHKMQRIVSKFQRHLTETDKMAEAEARWGPEVNAAMGPEPDIGKYARRYESLAKNLPNKDDL